MKESLINDGNLHSHDNVLEAESMMGNLIHTFDWSQTSLGHFSAWPEGLRNVLDFILKSKAPYLILWGKEGIVINNDAYAHLINKTEHGLGILGNEVWPEMPGFIEKIIETCLNGMAISYKNMCFKEASTKDGGTIWADLFCNPLEDGTGTPVGALIQISDITERVLTEENLKYAAKRFEVELDISEVIGTWDWNIKKDVFYSNTKFNTLFSGGTRENKEANLLSYYLGSVHPDDVENACRNVEKAIQTGEKYLDEFRLIKLDGGIRRVNAQGQCFYNQKGEPVKISGFIIDSELQQIGNFYYGNRESFKSVFNEIPVGIAQTDLSGKFVMVNDYYSELVGRSKEELYKMNLQDIIFNDDLQKSNYLLQQARENHLPFRLEKRYTKPDQTSVWVNINFSIVKDKQGNPAYFLGVCRDITERKRAEQAVKDKDDYIHIDNELDNFIYTASHDLKAPILNVEGLTTVLYKTLDPAITNSEKVKPLFDMINLSIDRFKNVLENLTEVVTIETAVDVDKKKVYFKELLEEVCYSLKNMIQEKNAIITEDFSQAPFLCFSKKNLKIVLYNLLSNALKFSSPERSPLIKITSTFSDEQHLLLSVKDNGLGINESDKLAVFQMFKRVHYHVDGSGIGLSIVKKIIEKNNGKVKLDSEVGNGSVFKLYFRI